MIREYFNCETILLFQQKEQPPENQSTSVQGKIPILNTSHMNVYFCPKNVIETFELYSTLRNMNVLFEAVKFFFHWTLK